MPTYAPVNKPLPMLLQTTLIKFNGFLPSKNMVVKGILGERMGIIGRGEERVTR